MATEKQLDFFKSLYEEEEARRTILADHAKSNIGLSTLYSAFILFAAEKLPPNTAPTRMLFATAVLAMLAAFLVSLWATQIAKFEAVADPAEVFDSYTTPPTDEEFFDDRIADYTVAYERNSEVNDRKADRLQLARYALLAGIAFHAAYFLVRIG